jgi:NADH-quinone oxidoreductase subunit J
MISLIFFYLFALLLVTSALFVIIAKNPVHSVLGLIMCFVVSAGLFIITGAEFLSMLLIIVYVGAVAVLFLFVVMMLDVNLSNAKSNVFKNAYVGTIIASIIFISIVAVIYANISKSSQMSVQFIQENNTLSIAEVLYTKYFLHFQMSGIILLVAIIGSISLTLRKRDNIKKQDYVEQISRENKIKLQEPVVGKGIDI